MKLCEVIKKNFDVVLEKTPDQSMDKYKCKYCPFKAAWHPTRFGKHLQNCRGCPDNVKETLESFQDSKPAFKRPRQSVSENNSADNEDIEINNNLQEKNSSQMVKISQRRIDNFVTHTSPQDQKIVTEALVKAFYCTGNLYTFIIHL